MKLEGKYLSTIFKNEVPTGTINGVNTDFVVSATPHSKEAVIVFMDGLAILPSEFTLVDETITITAAPSAGQSVFVFYIKR